MEAGRAIDAEVAEKLMGWTVQLIVARPESFEEWRDHQGWRYGPTPPPYSTDIAAAWQIVERADEVELWNHTGKQFGCRLIFGDREGRSVAETAPLAICLAALQAVGVEVPI